MTAFPGVFVTGTGTGVGKSVVAAALAATLVAEGRDVVASKPLLSGLDEEPQGWPHDHELLAAITGEAAEQIAPHRYGPAVSPHLAARWAGETHTPKALAAEVHARWQERPGATAIVEGAGGLLVPIDEAGATMADLAHEIGLPLLIAAHPGLGTINHVMLTVEAARTRELPIAGIVLTPWGAAPSLIDTDNAAYLAARTGLPVRRLARISEPTPAALASAGQAAGLATLLSPASPPGP